MGQQKPLSTHCTLAGRLEGEDGEQGWGWDRGWGDGGGEVGWEGGGKEKRKKER